jgi:hypothetical protein
MEIKTMTMDGYYNLVVKANPYYYGAIILQEGTFHLSNSFKFVEGAHMPAK